MPRKRKRTRPDTSNRSDLQTPRAPTGQPYGAHQDSIQSQQAVPLPQSRPPTPGAGAIPAAQAHNFQPVGLGDPTSRPDEPITAGLALGAGVGPGGLPQGQPPDPDALRLRPLLPILELMANQQDSSVAMRQYVRRLRAAIPPDA